MSRQYAAEPGRKSARLFAFVLSAFLALTLSGCGANEAEEQSENAASTEFPEKQTINDAEVEGHEASSEDTTAKPDADGEKSETESQPEPSLSDAAQLAEELGIVEDYREEFSHGVKTKEYQRYIMLHDTESDAAPQSIVEFWDGANNGVAAHFVVGKDGTIVQCVPLDQIAHHAGYGDAGHNALYGLVEDGRDDMVGTVPIGDWAPDYGMNAWSVGIEMVHVGGEGEYPEEQLAAVDALIKYIDAYFGMESEIVDHKAWRTGNSDTSAEFAVYLANYQVYRTHDGE